MKAQQDILIFSTSIKEKQEIERIAQILDKYPKIENWNVDFEDWEKILRIESNGLSVQEISDALKKVDIQAVELLN